MRILLTTLGGFGDSLMLTMPAQRLKKLFPDAFIEGQSRIDTFHILKNNPNFDKLSFRKGWSEIPVFNVKEDLNKKQPFDIVVDFRYSVKTFYNNGLQDFDISAKRLLKRQKKVELDLYVNDIPHYRMKGWVNYLDHRFDGRFHIKQENWYSLISYFSGLNFSPEDLYIHQEVVPDIPEDYIAVSSPTVLRGWSKLYPYIHWLKLFSLFPKIKFMLLGTAKNLALNSENVIHNEGKFNIFQTAYLINKARFLISEEGGLVHIAKAVKKKSIVLFGSTPKWFFGYKDNINLRGEVDCKHCFHQWEFWFEKCAKNKNSPYCLALENLKPEIVAEKIKELL